MYVSDIKLEFVIILSQESVAIRADMSCLKQMIINYVVHNFSNIPTIFYWNITSWKSFTTNGIQAQRPHLS